MRLVKDWKNCLRWYSSKAAIVSMSLQLSWLALPPKLQDSIPDNLVVVLTSVLLVLGFIGRLIKQDHKQEDDDKQD